MVSASLVVAAVMTIIGASALALVQSCYLYSIFFGFWQLTRFPMNIYPAALQWILVTAVPLGFMSYAAVAAFLGKDVALLGGLAVSASVLAGPIAVTIAMMPWRWSSDDIRAPADEGEVGFSSILHDSGTLYPAARCRECRRQQGRALRP